MKKHLALLCGCLLLSTTALAQEQQSWAERCACSSHGGTPIKDGQFCKSNQPMTWIAAHAWCYALGGRMASVATACPVVQSNKCQNMKNSYTSTVWLFINRRNGSKCQRVKTSDGTYGETQPINRGVRAASGETSTYGGITDMYALCEEKP